MLVFNYPSKKAMRESIGSPLDYTETSLFGLEYNPNATLVGSNRPQITSLPFAHKRGSREFFAQVTLVDGIITKVS